MKFAFVTMLLAIMICGCNKWEIKLGPVTSDPILQNEFVYLSEIKDGKIVITDTITVMEYMERHTPIPQDTTVKMVQSWE